VTRTVFAVSAWGCRSRLGTLRTLGGCGFFCLGSELGFLCLGCTRDGFGRDVAGLPSVSDSEIIATFYGQPGQQARALVFHKPVTYIIFT
jgi:hypothetical protein